MNRRESQQPESHTASSEPSSESTQCKRAFNVPTDYLSTTQSPHLRTLLFAVTGCDTSSFAAAVLSFLRFLSSRLHADTQPADLGNQQKQIGWGAHRRRRLPPSSLTGSFSTQLHNSASLGQLFPGRAWRALTTCKQCFSARCSRGLPGSVPAAQRLFGVLT